MAPLNRFDPTSLDLTEFDLTSYARATAAATSAIATRTTTLAQDAAYVTVGLALLGFQRAQVKRREAERAISTLIRPRPD
ncbi:MAG: hypothetical protein WBP59_08715 [Ilumatobacteraceae bacterium]